MQKMLINWSVMSVEDLEAELRAEKPHCLYFDRECDLFHESVPTKRIVEILDACDRVPKHDYVFLSGSPQRYAELDELALLPRRRNFYYCACVRGDELAQMYPPELGERRKEEG